MIPASRRKGWLQAAGIVGMLTPVFGFSFIGAAIAAFPQFSWTNNALSDLGIVPGVASILFNLGLCVSGLMFAVFSVGLLAFFGDRAMGKIGAAMFFLTSLSLEGIGIFPENARPFHFIFSVMFFALLPLALLTATAYFALERKKSTAIFTLLIAAAAASPWVLLLLVRYVAGVAIPELVSAAAGAAWVVLIGYRMFKGPSISERPARDS